MFVWRHLKSLTTSLYLIAIIKLFLQQRFQWVTFRPDHLLVLSITKYNNTASLRHSLNSHDIFIENVPLWCLKNIALAYQSWFSMWILQYYNWITLDDCVELLTESLLEYFDKGFSSDPTDLSRVELNHSENLGLSPGWTLLTYSGTDSGLTLVRDRVRDVVPPSPERSVLNMSGRTEQGLSGVPDMSKSNTTPGFGEAVLIPLSHQW